MDYYPDCQFRDKTAGCLECYSDKVIDLFAASYLVTATAMLETHRQIDQNPIGAHQGK